MRQKIEYEIYEVDDKFTSEVPLWVKSEYMKENFNINFNQYYERIRCHILFIPAQNDWENAKKRELMENIISKSTENVIVNIINAMHAYIWLFSPDEVGKATFDFIMKK